MDTHNKGRLHRILSSSYLFYFVLFFIGISFDLMFPTHFFENTYTASLGFVFIVFASFLILWVKSNSKKLKKGILTKEDFMQGPYKYTSIPNHWGIFILMLGFGIMINAVFMIILTIVSFLFTLPVFLKMQENILAEKYGVPYLEYRKTVKF
ncbi:MAG: hypothetical protein AAB493_02520 [Patescibacteria group bacterium]